MSLSQAPFPAQRAVFPTLPEKLLVQAVDVGVKYVLGKRREDLKSMANNFFRRWPRRQQEVRWALQHVDLAGYAGDVIGIIGGNGAGKTTLCRALCGLLRPDTGSLQIDGKVSSLLSLGVGFHAELSGRENLLLSGMMLGVSRHDLHALLPEIIAFAGLERFIDQPLKHYSSGMRARLGFSVLSVLEPDILIIDEALSVGDLEFSEKAGQKMRELAARAKLVFVVTHQLQFVERYCSQALWLAGGRMMAHGVAADVVHAYTEFLPKGQAKKGTTVVTPPPSLTRSEPVIEVRNLSVRFAVRKSQTATNPASLLQKIWLPPKDLLWALQGLTFTVREGEVVGIIGPNGAGKTTLCRVLTGILKADCGEVKLKGALTALLTFGTGFNEQLTGRDNVYLNGMMLGMSKRRVHDVYENIVQFSGLTRFMDEPVKHYSTGMRVRLGFSIATAINPDLLILDEALNVGDMAFYEKASAKIQQLITEAKAVIVVTHNLAFVQRVCTRAVWLKKGVLQFDGDPREAVAAYQQSLKKEAR